VGNLELTVLDINTSQVELQKVFKVIDYFPPLNGERLVRLRKKDKHHCRVQTRTISPADYVNYLRQQFAVWFLHLRILSFVSSEMSVKLNT